MARGTRLPGEISQLARDQKVPVEAVDPLILAQRAGIEVHQGVVALTTPLRTVDVTDLLDASPPPDFLVALDGVLDPQNLGAVMRVAEASGANGLILPERRSAPLSAVAQKASAGASEYLPIAVVSNLVTALEQAKSAGMWIVGLEAGGSALSECALLEERVVLVAGSEGSGMRPLVRSHCDALCGIDLRGHVDSLNVSTAAAVACFKIAELHARKA